ncbi:MAG TPA: GWxTD domain-containing protein [Acidobacteriaceae bacterium]|nr:GWxTD domain-containing protein [Acidobacteriaceae bacterium]
MSRHRSSLLSVLIIAMLTGAGAAVVQAQPPHQNQDSDQTLPGQNPLTRKLSSKERFKQQKELRNELSETYKKWLNEDVRWIITPEERKAFLSLTNDEERDAFIEQFWRRRNPNPDSPDNTFRDEYYRRIAYANEHFAAGEPGWMTDRGMIYIKFGPPDSIDSHPSGGLYDRPIDEGGGETDTFPFEDWHYRYIPGIGENINIEFVDSCMCGDYEMTIDRSKKDALLHVPGAGQTLYEQMGMAKKSQRFQGGLEDLGPGPDSATQQSKEFDRLELYAKLEAPPVIQFKDMDLANFLTSHKVLSGPFFPFQVRTDFVKVTDDTVLVPITLQIRNRDMTFNTKDGVATANIDIMGQVSTITDRIVQSFETPVQVQEPSELLSKSLNNVSLYWQALPLPPGRYRIDIAIKDENNPDHVGVWAQAIDVPEYRDDQLAASSLILADQMERVPAEEIGAGSFIIGDTYVRPRVSFSPTRAPLFHRNQNLNFWMQVYNLGLNRKTKKNDAVIHYQIVDAVTNKTLLNTSEDSDSMSPNSDQLTLEKTLPLASLEPGKYIVKISVDDGVDRQQIAESAPFTVEQ